MGCSSSKSTDVAAVYRPPPSSFAVFDITAIEEPWLKNEGGGERDSQEYKVSNVPPPILEKLKSLEETPRSWDEVSKALEDLKPKLNQEAQSSPTAAKKALPKNLSYHTLEDLEAKTVDSSRVGSKSLKDNMFIVRDRQERENAGKSGGFVRRDPLGDFEEKCADAVVIYTTSLGGVRRTATAFGSRWCTTAAAVPRVLVKDRYIGGVEEVVGLNEVGRLSGERFHPMSRLWR